MITYPVGPYPVNICLNTSPFFAATNSAGIPVWVSSDPTKASIDSSLGLIHLLGVGVVTFTNGLSDHPGDPDNFTLNIEAVPIVTDIIDDVTGMPAAGTGGGAFGICPGTTHQFSNTTSGGVWSVIGTTTSMASVDSTGLLTVPNFQSGPAFGLRYTVTNSSGCSSFASIGVATNSLPSIGSTSGDSTVIVGATSTLANSVTGGSWSSSNSAIASVNAFTGVVTGVVIGSCSIIYRTTDSVTGCTNSVSFAFSVTSSGGGSGTNTCCPVGYYYVDALGNYIDPVFGKLPILNGSGTTPSFSDCLTNCCAIANPGYNSIGGFVITIVGSAIACPCCPPGYPYNSTTGFCTNTTTGQQIIPRPSFCLTYNCTPIEQTPCPTCGSESLPITFAFDAFTRQCTTCKPPEGLETPNGKFNSFVPYFVAGATSLGFRLTNNNLM